MTKLEMARRITKQLLALDTLPPIEYRTVRRLAKRNRADLLDMHDSAKRAAESTGRSLSDAVTVIATNASGDIVKVEIEAGKIKRVFDTVGEFWEQWDHVSLDDQFEINGQVHQACLENL